MLNRGTGEGKLGSRSQLGNIITFAVGTFFIAQDDFKSYVSFVKIASQVGIFSIHIKISTDQEPKRACLRA